MIVRLKTSQIKPYKENLLKTQKNCQLCQIDFQSVESKNICLDHCHVTGQIRGLLCRNCNGIEGKIWNLVRRGARQGGSVIGYMTAISEYWQKHVMNPSGVYHPTHKTEDEKRLKRNAQARARRAERKA